MARFLRCAWSFLWKPPLLPLRFPTTGFEVIGKEYLLEEEQLKGFQEGWYYPVNIGEVFLCKYQVLGKLGFGVTSTVWLARNLV